VSSSGGCPARTPSKFTPLLSDSICPRCGGAMRILAFLTEPAVIDRILTHLRTRAPPAPARDPPSLTRRLRTVGTAPRALRP
jgi:hypothetical protein